MKNLNSKITQLMNPHEVTCNKILHLIYNYNDIMTFSHMRELCYDIFIYNLDIYECIWYMLRNILNSGKIRNDDIHKILVKTFSFFKYYNNNYRPIYHLENYVLYLISVINGFD